MNELLYCIYQGTIYELNYTLENNKYRLDVDNILNKRVVLENQLNEIHGKKFNAYIVGFDLDAIIEIYTNYMDKQIILLEDELQLLRDYKDVF